MSTAEIILQLALALVAGAIGWLARGIFDEIRRHQRDRAWVKARRFFWSRNNKV